MTIQREADLCLVGIKEAPDYIVTLPTSAISCRTERVRNVADADLRTALAIVPLQLTATIICPGPV
jgi:hypothetical protein